MNSIGPKILMVANYKPDTGGISAVVENLTNGLRKEGYCVDIHSITGPILKRVLAYTVLFFRVRNYDVIHAHGSSFWGILPAFIATFVCSIYKKRVIITYHGFVTKAPVFLRKSRMAKYIIRKAALITCPIDDNAKLFRDRGAKAVGIANIFDRTKWEFTRRDRISPKLIWTRGTYQPELAVETFKIIKKQYPKTTLTMCGKLADSRYLSQYKDLPDIYLHGFVPRNKLSLLLDNADIYINTAAGDSFGYCMFEAMAMGLAVVSVESVALRVYAGADSVTFSTDETAESLAAAALELITDQELALGKIDHACKVVDKFSWAKLFPIWENVYGEVLEK